MGAREIVLLFNNGCYICILVEVLNHLLGEKCFPENWTSVDQMTPAIYTDKSDSLEYVMTFDKNQDYISVQKQVTRLWHNRWHHCIEAQSANK